LKRIPAANPKWSGGRPDPASSFAPYRIFNIGNSQPVELMRLVGVLEESLGVKAKLNLLPLQPGDVLATFADVADLEMEIGFRPRTSIEVGVRRFVDWYREFYQVGAFAPAAST
jgi:UDP-glucuronate 4-epimerase